MQALPKLGWILLSENILSIFFADCLQKFINPLWGHRSISIDSDQGALQPYFFGSYGYPSVAIFRVHAVEW